MTLASNPIQQHALTKPALAAMLLFLGGCAGDPNSFLKSLQSVNSESSTALGQEVAERRALQGTRIVLHSSSFYSLTQPNSQSCAGDARVFQPFPSTSETATLPSSILDGGETQRPAFITNVSVDLTNSNIEADSNKAVSCSVRPSIDSKPARCAIFDQTAGDAAGLVLDGGILLVGGRQTNALGTSSSIDPFEYSLVLPNAGNSTGSTVWNDLIREELFSGGATSRPSGKMAPSSAFNESKRELLLFGGSSPQPTAENWIFSTESRQWTLAPTVVFPRVFEQRDASTGTLLQTIKTPSGRANFGYLPVTGFSYSDFDMALTDPPTVDLSSEKILITSGVSQLGFQDSYLFDPSFAPEHLKVPSSLLVDGDLKEWIESFHTRRLSTLQSQTLFGNSALQRPPLTFNLATSVNTASDTFTYSSHGLSNGEQVVLADASPTGNATAPGGTDFGTVYTVSGVSTNTFELHNGVGLIDLTSTGTGLATLVRAPGPVQGVFMNEIGTGSSSSASIPVHWGGFDWSAPAPGRVSEDLKRMVGKASQLLPSLPSFSGGVQDTNRLEIDLDGRVIRSTASDIHTWSDTSGAGGGFGAIAGSPNQVPGFGGFSMHVLGDSSPPTAFSIGGTSCRNYLLTQATPCAFNDRIYSSTDLYPPQSAVDSTPGSAPTARAGMASAVGIPLGGTSSVIVLFGGLSEAGVALGSTPGQKVFVKTSNAGIQEATVTSGSKPPPLVNAQMVYSRITRKFYLYGGMVPQSQTVTRGDTWELTLTQSVGLFSASWRKLNDVGMTCWPQCPTARRSHRMVEVSYATAATGTQSAPHSFAIFMEGGTPNGLDFFSDRWMFDPTANGGAGHWLNVNGFPGRRLAAMTTYEVTLQNGTRQTRALLFGGETGLEASPIHSESTPAPTRYYLPPTLGDTQIFDFESRAWNRAELLGRGINTMGVIGGSDITSRQSYNNSVQIRALSPPPISGGLMVTRTHDESGAVLSVPELYLMGGRFKDGSYQPYFKEVWKYCPQSANESGNNAGDPTINSPCDSTVIDGFTGRWLHKTTTPVSPPGPDLTTFYAGIFLGAATYDFKRDRILLTGGYRPSGTQTDKITQASQSWADGSSHPFVLEFRPSTLEWQAVPACSHSPATPAPRYGHSLFYDSQNSRLMMVGGFAIGGSGILTDTSSPQPLMAQASSPNQIPEVWSASLSNESSGDPCYTWSAATPPPPQERIDSLIPPTGGFGFSTGFLIPSTGYGTGSYVLQDDQCAGTGPFATSDSSLSKKYSGGVAIDLDRTQLGSNENVLLQLTYIPLARGSELPGRKTASELDEPVINIHLLSTDLDRSALQAVFQPRHLFFFDTQEFPRVLDRLSVLAERDGQLREEQVVVPLSAFPSVDRIRIERVTGSAILISVSVQRMGPR
jgi:hypothetical protein